MFRLELYEDFRSERFQNAGAVSLVPKELDAFSFFLLLFGDMLQKPTCLDRKGIDTHEHFINPK